MLIGSHQTYFEEEEEETYRHEIALSRSKKVLVWTPHVYTTTGAFRVGGSLNGIKRFLTGSNRFYVNKCSHLFKVIKYSPSLRSTSLNLCTV